MSEQRAQARAATMPAPVVSERDLPPVHALTAAEIYAALGTSPAGLTSAEARARLRRYGPNTIAELPRPPLALRFLQELTHFFALLLWVAAALAFVGGLPELGWAICAVILINAVFSFWQEYKAERAAEALRRLLPAYATVVRDGEQQRILARDLVPGDVLVLAEGDRISADARLTEAFLLRTEQAALTGEALPVSKLAAPLQGSVSLLEAANLVFAGSTVTTGAGRAVVFATGMSTAFGRVAHLTQQVEAGRTSLQRELDHATRLIAALAVTVGVVFFGLGLLAGLPPLQGFLFTVGVIVALVPEGLLPTLTLALAIGVQRMAQRRALVRKLLAVEALGSCTVICTDKTGTLTENQMTVRFVWQDGREWTASGEGYNPAGTLERAGAPAAPGHDAALDALIRTAVLANNARLAPPGEGSTEWTALGDPTEAALLVVARKAGYDERRTRAECPRHFELAFDSGRKRMSVITLEDGQRVVHVKGAPREVLDRCTTTLTPDGVVPLTDERRAAVLAANDRYARDGLRVLAFARRAAPPADAEGVYHPDAVERDLTLLGLMAMLDPPRPEVAVAVRRAHGAGIRILMVTGDYGLTAASIARRIGIVQATPPRIVSGSDLDGLTDAQLGDLVAQGETIFARVSPEHKLRVVAALEERGETVAVTGDGVNDAPALKRADIGVAMGVTGTDVAKEAADLVLLDDNFATIVAAIEQGRAVYDNIKKFVTYVFVSNVAELVPFVAMVFFGVPLPLTVLQVLAVDLGTDMLPALALGAEQPEPGVMERPPRPRGQHLMDAFLLVRGLVFLGGLEAAAGMAGYFFGQWSAGWRPGLPLAADGPAYLHATTLTLACIVAGQVGAAFTVRTERASVFSIGLFSNRLLLGGVAFELALLAAIAYVPFLQQVFGTAPLTAQDWAFMAVWPLVLFGADEARKWVARR